MSDYFTLGLVGTLFATAVCIHFSLGKKVSKRVRRKNKSKTGPKK